MSEVPDFLPPDDELFDPSEDKRFAELNMMWSTNFIFTFQLWHIKDYMDKTYGLAARASACGQMVKAWAAAARDCAEKEFRKTGDQKEYNLTIEAIERIEIVTLNYLIKT